jgi:Xylose isomerase-like TIM barrel
LATNDWPRMTARYNHAEMKAGVNTMIWSGQYDHRVRELLPLINENGFAGIEFPLFRPDGFKAATVRKDTEAGGPEGTVASGFIQGLSPISDNAATRTRALQYLKGLIGAAAEAGAKLLCGAMYSPVGYLPGGRRTSDERKWAVEGLQSLGDTLSANNVTLAIEPLARGFARWANICGTCMRARTTGAFPAAATSSGPACFRHCAMCGMTNGSRSKVSASISVTSVALPPSGAILRRRRNRLHSTASGF